MTLTKPFIPGSRSILQSPSVFPSAWPSWSNAKTTSNSSPWRNSGWSCDHQSQNFDSKSLTGSTPLVGAWRRKCSVHARLIQSAMGLGQSTALSLPLWPQSFLWVSNSIHFSTRRSRCSGTFSHLNRLMALMAYPGALLGRTNQGGFPVFVVFVAVLDTAVMSLDFHGNGNTNSEWAWAS